MELNASTIDCFRSLGCSETDVRLYIHLLKRGPTTIQELAKASGINRVTTHSAIERLKNHGFVYETFEGNRRRIAPEPPETLFSLVKRKEDEVRSLQHSLEHIVNFLGELQPTAGALPRVSFYESVNGFKKMLEDTLKAKGEVLVFIFVDTFAEILGAEALFSYYSRRAARGIKSRLIFPNSALATEIGQKGLRWKMQIRTLDNVKEWKSGIFSWNDSLALLSFTAGHLTCTVIQNEDISAFYRNLVFELCWQQAKPLSRRT